MQTLFIKEKIPYTGKELQSQFAYNRFDLAGESMVAFCGKCDVKISDLVDLADVKENAPIYSDYMLHFIYESFEGDLERTILKQRLLTAIIRDELASLSGAHLERRGDDIYDGDAKLSVSIATSTPVSFIMHTGINISSKNTPVKTAGLEDYGIGEVGFAGRIMGLFAEEVAGMRFARCKVRGVR